MGGQTVETSLKLDSQVLWKAEQDRLKTGPRHRRRVEAKIQENNHFTKHTHWHTVQMPLKDTLKKQDVCCTASILWRNLTSPVSLNPCPELLTSEALWQPLTFAEGVGWLEEAGLIGYGLWKQIATCWLPYPSLSCSEWCHRIVCIASTAVVPTDIGCYICNKPYLFHSVSSS